MAVSEFSFQRIMQIVISDSGIKPSSLALYCNRERTLIYKWLSGRCMPKASLLPVIAHAVAANTTSSRKIILENDLLEYIHESNLTSQLKDCLIQNCSTEDRLLEMLDLSISDSLPIVDADSSLLPESTFRRSVWIIPAGTVFFSVLGGLLWNLLNHLSGWTFYMGSPDNEPTGLSAFIWGVVSLLPLSAFAFLYIYKINLKSIFGAAVYTILGGLAALLFYTISLRSIIAAMGFPYALQESLIVILYACIISLPPYISALFAREPLSVTFRTILNGLLPVGITFLACAMTFIIDRPAGEIAQLRGFVVGLTLRISMAAVLIFALKESEQFSDQNKEGI